jgi:hypothetical protein
LTKVKAAGGGRIRESPSAIGRERAPRHRPEEPKALLAAVIYQSGFPVDTFMAAVVGGLQAEGMRVGGAVQLNAGSTACSVMSLQNLATGERFGISQQLGSYARGCRLDPLGLATATAQLEAATMEGLELLVLNKFGKAEAEGGGLRGVLARALECGVPVLTAVRSPYTDAWLAFHGGLATELAPCRETTLDWCRTVARKSVG